MEDKILKALQGEYPDIDIKPIFHPTKQYILDNKQAIGYATPMAFATRRVTTEDILKTFRLQINRYQKSLDSETHGML